MEVTDDQVAQFTRLSKPVGWILGLVAFTVTGATINGPGLTWDEPTYRDSQLGIERWMDAVKRDGFREMMDPEEINHYWEFNRQGTNFHPPMSAYLNLGTYGLLGSFFDDVSARRVASAIAFAATVGLMSVFVVRRYGVLAGVFAGLSLTLMPRMVGDAHIMGTDIPMLFFWTAASVLFPSAMTHRNRQWMLALVLACLFLSKFNGMIILLPMGLAWFVVMLRRDRDGFRRWMLGSVVFLVPVLPTAIFVLFGGPAATGQREPLRLERWFLEHPTLANASLAWPFLVLMGYYARSKGGQSNKAFHLGWEWPWTILSVTPLVCVLLNPTWWHDPVVQLSKYLELHVRRHHSHPDITIYFLGEKYINSLPWYNAFVLMGLTIPVGTLAIGMVGIIFGTTKQLMVKWYLFGMAFTLPLIRMFPVPAHDGVRLFLPTFVFWSALSGLGAVRLARNRPWIWPMLFAAGPGWSAWEWAKCHPHELSYYNVGFKRAVALGMEATYWYDAVTPRVLKEINEGPKAIPLHTPIIAHLDRIGNTETFLALQRLGKLRGDLVLNPQPITARTWVFMQNHCGKSTPIKRLLNRCPPVYEKEFDGVRLFGVFDFRALNVASAIAAMVLAEGHTEEFQAATFYPDAGSAGGAQFRLALAAFRDEVALPAEDNLANRLVNCWRDNPVSRGLLAQIEHDDPQALDQAVCILEERRNEVWQVIQAKGYFDGPTPSDRWRIR